MTAVKPWREISSTPLLDCRVFGVEALQSLSPVDGSEHRYFRITSNDWVQLVPVTADRKVVMVRQYRHGSAEMSLEVPAGAVDGAESPQAAAVRECLEETGYLAKVLTPLGVMRPNPAYFSNRLYGYFALDVEPVAPIKNTGTEQTEVELVPVDRVAELLQSGAIDHALAAAVLWRFLHEIT